LTLRPQRSHISSSASVTSQASHSQSTILRLWQHAPQLMRPCRAEESLHCARATHLVSHFCWYKFPLEVFSSPSNNINNHPSLQHRTLCPGREGQWLQRPFFYPSVALWSFLDLHLSNSRLLSALRAPSRPRFSWFHLVSFFAFPVSSLTGSSMSNDEIRCRPSLKRPDKPLMLNDLVQANGHYLTDRKHFTFFVSTSPCAGTKLTFQRPGTCL
jgi:hypothetical protein